MKVIKENIDPNKKSKFGNFELKPDNGWKMSEPFLDYESKLLVVGTSDENEDNWIEISLGSRVIPTKEYIIDPENGNILSFAEWSKYFSYEPKEIISEDGKLKVCITRVHEPERNSDGIMQELTDLATGHVIASSDGIAFTENKRENLLESHYREKRERAERLAIYEAMPTLEQHFEQAMEKLEEGDIMATYYNDTHIFELEFKQKQFILKKVKKKWQYDLDWDKLDYTIYKKYTYPEEFKADFLMTREWFFKHRPFRRTTREASSFVLTKYIVQFFNGLRATHDFTYAEYDQINSWENFFYQTNNEIKTSEYKQYCANCKKVIGYHPRYPKCICNACSSKKITDENGVELSFSNVGISGGLSIQYKKNGKVIKEDNSQIEKICFIDGKLFVATEARFGGIVIQSHQ